MKFNIDKIVFVLIILIVVGIIVIPKFGDELREVEIERKKSNIEYKYPISEKDGWYISEHCRFNVEEWDNLYIGESGYTEISEFLHFVDLHVDTISKLLGFNNLGDEIITFTLATEGYGSVDKENNLIEYSNYYFLNNVKKAYEVLQLMIEPSNSDSLNEGLSYYIDQHTNKIIRKDRLQDIICRSKVDMSEENIVMLQYVGEDGQFTYVKEDGNPYLNRQMYALYSLSRSFCTYLIDEYGMDKFLELYFSEDINSQYTKTYGKSLEELREIWIEYVNQRYKEVYGD